LHNKHPPARRREALAAEDDRSAKTRDVIIRSAVMADKVILWLKKIGMVIGLVLALGGACFAAYEFVGARDQKHVAQDLLLQTHTGQIASHDAKLTHHDSKFDRFEARIDETVQLFDSRMDATEKVQLAIQKDQQALLKGQMEIKTQQSESIRFKMDMIKEFSELSGYLKSIENINVE
jgi:hypothetical protein